MMPYGFCFSYYHLSIIMSSKYLKLSIIDLNQKNSLSRIDISINTSYYRNIFIKIKYGLYPTLTIIDLNIYYLLYNGNPRHSTL